MIAQCRAGERILYSAGSAGEDNRRKADMVFYNFITPPRKSEVNAVRGVDWCLA